MPAPHRPVCVLTTRATHIARSALARLYSPDGRTPRYPLAFLTNGGGVTEQYKAHQLSEWLGVHVRESQVRCGRCCAAPAATRTHAALIVGRACGTARGGRLLSLCCGAARSGTPQLAGGAVSHAVPPAGSAVRGPAGVGGGARPGLSSFGEAQLAALLALLSLLGWHPAGPGLSASCVYQRAPTTTIARPMLPVCRCGTWLAPTASGRWSPRTSSCAPCPPPCRSGA